MNKKLSAAERREENWGWIMVAPTIIGLFMDTTNFPMLMAGSLLAMLPMVVLYLIFQRQFVEGIAGTGGK